MDEGEEDGKVEGFTLHQSSVVGAGLFAINKG